MTLIGEAENQGGPSRNNSEVCARTTGNRNFFTLELLGLPSLGQRWVLSAPSCGESLQLKPHSTKRQEESAQTFCYLQVLSLTHVRQPLMYQSVGSRQYLSANHHVLEKGWQGRESSVPRLTLKHNVSYHLAVYSVNSTTVTLRRQRKLSDEPFLIPLTFPIENRPRDTICSQIVLIPPSGYIYSPSGHNLHGCPHPSQHHSFLDKSTVS